MKQDNMVSILEEMRVFSPPQSDTTFSSLQDWQAIHDRFEQNFTESWADLARQNLLWKKPFTKTLDESNPPFYQWFSDGQLNLSENCLDRHVNNGLGERTAIIWEGEPGDVRHISYAALLSEVCQAANTLKSLGVQKSDRVVIYMPMIPEAAIAMLACMRIGATHSVVFSAFSAQALADRVKDAGACLVITADGGYRRGQVHDLKTSVDDALNQGCDSVKHVLVVKRGGHDIPWQEDRDVDWHEALANESNVCPAEALDSEHPSFILYT
ncbi:MAG: AMP-binding protein, partial [Mariprofundaceae bacterium]|nr:AMP-binding protein [Mariprofundaceae bacterium]